MLKQEIENLKAGDKIIVVGEKTLTIEEVFKSDTTNKIFLLYTNGNYDWGDTLLEYRFKLKKQPKKTPYTADTFPENAIWIREKNAKEMMSFSIYDGNIIDALGNGINLDSKYIIENCEIGCQVIKDGEIKIEWRPFYIEE